MISRAEAIDMFRSGDLIAIGMEADSVRRRLHPAGIVSYSVTPLEAPEPDSSTVTVTMRAGDSADFLIDRFDEVRKLQEQTGSVVAFMLLPEIDVTAVEYLKALAVSRIYLENVPHIQGSSALGLKTCQLTLRFGSDDAGPAIDTTEEDLRRIIRDAGFTPKQRDARYQTYSLN